MKTPLRCAIYTRVSTEHGLDQAFNSLDNQREAAEAYVKSQAHEGWRMLRDRYDDGGFSGGSMERPALQRLLEQVRARRVDVIVVYKVDRLTRSLADFAKLVELFDGHCVSFVSVTQAFNTTTSMGRLTLNVLLSFAQFEREVTGERIRDKIAASKRRGLWMGGNVPFGYGVEARKLVPVEEEAARVRLIFARYLELGGIDRLVAELRDQGVVTRQSVKASGMRGGIPFTRGPLAYLLRNRTYIGEIAFRGEVHPAEHPAIVDRAVFEAVQRRLTEGRSREPGRATWSGALLTGKLFDEQGHKMTPTHCRKAGIRYRYYMSRTRLDGLNGRGTPGPIRRIPALAIEQRIVEAIAARRSTDEPDRDLAERVVERIDLAPGALHVTLMPGGDGPAAIDLPWQQTSSRRHREMIATAGGGDHARPMRAEARERLLQAVARGRRWLDEILSGAASDPDVIAARERCTRRQVNATVSLAHLAPDIVEAAIAGRLPHGLAMRDLIDPPPAWSEQRRKIGMPA